MANYDYYRIFYYVAQYQSFTKAAEMLRNNQPNITRYINNLESELGCKLFIRSNRGVKLTPEGENLFEHVAIAQEHLRLGESELQKEKELNSGLITLGVSENALRIQIWTAMISLLIIRWMHHLSKMKWSFSNMSAMLRMNLFTYRSLLEWLDKPYETPPAVPQFEQLGLFD